MKPSIRSNGMLDKSAAGDAVGRHYDLLDLERLTFAKANAEQIRNSSAKRAKRLT